MPAPLRIDVRPVDLDLNDVLEGLIVVVEPVYGCVAVSAALDAGWDSVELAAERSDEAPIPLISFEQGATVRGGRCRVRGDDLYHAVAQLAGDARTIVVGSIVNARPLASLLARQSADHERVTFVLAATHADAGAIEHAPLDGYWSAGALIRVLLEELDGRASVLTDSAGIAVTLAQGAEDVGAQLSAGVRWQRHLDRGGSADDLRVASALDSVGAVPVVAVEGGVPVARAWVPSAVEPQPGS